LKQKKKLKTIEKVLERANDKLFQDFFDSIDKII